MKGFVLEFGKMAKKIILLAILTILFVCLAGGNTVQGIGRDITAIGEFGQNVIEKDEPSQ